MPPPPMAGRSGSSGSRRPLNRSATISKLLSDSAALPPPRIAGGGRPPSAPAAAAAAIGNVECELMDVPLLASTPSTLYGIDARSWGIPSAYYYWLGFRSLFNFNLTTDHPFLRSMIRIDIINNSSTRNGSILARSSIYPVIDDS